MLRPEVEILVIATDRLLYDTPMNQSKAGEASPFLPILCVLVALIVVLSIAFVVKVRKETREDLESLKDSLARAQAEYDKAVSDSNNDKRPSFENISAKEGRLSWEGGATFHFTVTNGSTHAITKFRFRAALNQYQPVFQTIANETGWHELDSPLQPRESRVLSLGSNNSSSWGGPVMTDSLAQTDGFRFIVSILGAYGKEGLEFKEKDGIDFSRVRELDDRIRKYREQIERLE